MGPTCKMETETLKKKGLQLRNKNLKMDIFIPTEMGLLFLKAESMSKHFHSEAYRKLLQRYNLYNQKVAVFHLVSFGTPFF